MAASEQGHPKTSKKAVLLSAIAVVIAVVVAVGAMLTTSPEHDADAKDIKDTYYEYNDHGWILRACVYDDGVSGFIEFKEGMEIELSHAYNQKNKLTSIGGTALKDIVKFKGGGYVESFFFTRDDALWHWSRIIGKDMELVLHANAKGSGNAHVKFVEMNDDSHEMSISGDSLEEHSVGNAYFDSAKGAAGVKRIEWYS